MGVAAEIPSFGGRAGLRMATAATHERMHALPEFTAIEAGTLSLDDYGRLVATLYRFQDAMGAAAQAGGLGALSGAPRRLPLLAADLAVLGRAAPCPGHGWQSPSRAFLLGGLYVAEGSMLGGKVIARQLDYLFGARLDGRRFFAGTNEDKPAWRRLVALLERECTGAGLLGETVEGAEAAFAFFQRSVEQAR